MKIRLKELLSSYSTTFDYPIIVNSYGRSGSTVLTKSIIDSSIHLKNDKLKNIFVKSVAKPAWHLESTLFKEGMVYKTHDYPPKKDLNKDNIRMLYTFADPVDVIQSLLRLYEVRGEEWMKEHYDHLKVAFGNFKNIVNEDQLQLERHLSSWLSEENIPIAFIKYESMWDYQGEISNFLGFQVTLPTFRKRKAKENEHYRSEIKATYAPLREKIYELDDFFVKNL